MWRKALQRDTIRVMTSSPTSLPREQLRPLLVRRNGPGLARLALQTGVLVGSAIATVSLAQQGHSAWWITAASGGWALTFFFPSLHESGHKTAFTSGLLNSAVCWISAILMLQAPSFFREFHWAHHRHTQDRELDPEIASAPDLLANWPSNPFVYLALVSGQLLMVGKLMFTISSAVMPASGWDKLFPFIRPELRGRVAWESRFVLLVLASFFGGGLWFIDGFAHVFVIWSIAHLVLGFYLMPEHTGLPHDGSQAHRTRSIRSNRLFEWCMWNMPYHAEHHMHPAVPFHALPALREKVAPTLEHEVRGYLRFHLMAMARAFTGRLG